MPIISPIGRRTWRVRLALGLIYFVLILGSISMIYPLLLMLAGSIKSDTDFASATPAPAYLWDDDVLWKKYIESKYGLIPDAEAALHRPVGSWRSVQPPSPDEQQIQRAALFREFREQRDWPMHWYLLGHTQFRHILARNAREFRGAAHGEFDGDIARFSDAVGVRYPSWSHVGPPIVTFANRLFTYPDAANYRLYYELKAQAPKRDWVVVNLDGDFWRKYLALIWGDVEAYNAAHGTNHRHYREVLLSATAPPQGQARRDWETYVRHQLGLAFIRVDPSALPAFQRFVSERFAGEIDELNRLWETDYRSFDEIPLPQGAPGTTRAQVDYAEFLKHPEACPLEALSVYGPRQGFEAFVAARTGRLPEPMPLPIEAVDDADFREQTTSLRWEFIRRNYLAVWDYLWMHGRGIRNTIIFCTLLVLANLIVNPLAAYALSRYRPPSTYKILLLCMCTMAFPAEVTMIPSFLLLKRFPVYGLLAGIIFGLLAAWALHQLRPAWQDWKKGLLAGGIGILAGFWLAPALVTQVLGRDSANVSLLNTFWALVLPGMANGFSIFLLKGFFDSLPQELYEAAEIDGAGEWTKFWVITMTLSKPILAVLALTAFTVAYSEFMMALVIIPDPQMWTLMIWLFQLQVFAHPSVVYASLVIAAIPTLLVFLFAQNVIMRGIVVPVEK